MFGHMPELFIILVLALIVFGPEKLPEVAQSVGKAVREVRSAIDSSMHPQDHEVPEDFSTYYYESLARSGEPEPEEPEDEYDSPYGSTDPFAEDDDTEPEYAALAQEPIPLHPERAATSIHPADEGSLPDTAGGEPMRSDPEADVPPPKPGV